MAARRKISGYLSSGDPDIKWWRLQINQGIEYRKKYALEQDWNRWRQYYRGKWPANTLPVNIFFRMLRTVVPRIYFRNPSISVKATKPGMEQQLFAQLIERIDNKLIRAMNLKGQIKSMIHNTFMFGTSAGQLGFGAQYTPTPDTGATEGPVIFNKKMTRRVEYHHLVTPNMPWFLGVHPGDLIVPKGLTAWEQTPWVATQLKRNVHDLKADPRLENTDSIRSGSPGTISKPDSSPDDVTLWQIRDMRTGKVILISAYGGGQGTDDSPKPLLYENDALQNNNRPNIYPLIFNPDDEVFWGVPDSVILEPQQLELNEVRTLQMKHRRMSIMKFMYKGGAIDPAEIDKALDGDVMAAIRINQNSELSDVGGMEMAHIPESLIMMDGTIQGDIRDTMGFSRNQGGNYASDKSHNAPTAYEARIVEQASEIRVDERRDACADLLVNVFEDSNVLVFDEWDDDQVVQVMGPDSVPLWVQFKPNMLKAARYELQIDPDSTLPETKDLRLQKADKVYGVLKENPLIDPQLLTSYYLREMHGVEYDHLMKAVNQVQKNASQGLPGSTPDNPMGAGQLMGMMAGRGRGPAPG